MPGGDALGPKRRRSGDEVSGAGRGAEARLDASGCADNNATRLSCFDTAHYGQRPRGHWRHILIFSFLFPPKRAFLGS